MLVNIKRQTDGGKEFDNQLLDKCFNIFNIQHFLSKKSVNMIMQWRKQHLKALKLSLLKEKNLWQPDCFNKPLRLMLTGAITNDYMHR
ncbi:hypothetical protein BHC49_13290 [Snodgrassella alvi]|uniref:Integrase catalytic domain-containing protein n=1 Tax=Snodgrassella alvi TaxID=1196083 RepID=A0A2N9XV50_9NEIS|nr:hypothetical protein BHC49_13290 [Snodgrassella alvi]